MSVEPKNRKKIKERMDALAKEIRYHAKKYYEEDNPVISDEAYDSLFRELLELEEQYPELKDPLSPTTRVGGKVLDSLKKVRHHYPQWSFDNVFSYEELKEWERRIFRLLHESEEFKNLKKLEYVVELKIDGLKVILDYENGRFIRAATRGDGVFGEDISENAKTIRDIPFFINKKKSLSVVGEIWISKDRFKKINYEREKNGLPLYANPRNLAAGTVRQLDTSITAERKLSAFVYDFESEEIKFKTHIEELSFLSSLSFPVNPHTKKCVSLEEVQEFYEEWKEKRRNEEYGIDGIVIKINNKDIASFLGYTSKAPRFAIAYKFPAEQKTTILRDIVFQIGRSGIITPVAVFDPVEIDGSFVRRATLHNENEIRRLDLHIGDTIIVEKSGDIIPKIVSVLSGMRTDEKEFSMEDSLKEKGIHAIKKVSPSGIIHWYVSDSRIDEKKIQSLIYFTSKKGINIEGLGEERIRQLYHLGFVKKFSDFFQLTKEQLQLLPHFKEKSIKNFFQSLERSKRVSFRSFLTSLGIPHVGEEISFLLAKHFKKPSLLLERILLDDLQKIDGIGEIVSKSLVDWFSKKENREKYKKLQSILDIFCEKNINSEDEKKPLKGLNFVATGTLDNFSRAELKKKIESLGGKLSTSLSKNTHYLIVGENPGSKKEKANKLGIPILSEEEFIEFIHS